MGKIVKTGGKTRATGTLKRVSDQSAAKALREILFNTDNKIDWEKAGFSIIENMPELKMFE